MSRPRVLVSVAGAAGGIIVGAVVVLAALGGGVPQRSATAVLDVAPAAVQSKVTADSANVPPPGSASLPAAPLPAVIGLPDLYRAAAPGVVVITTRQGAGSGFVVDGDGDVLTNFHVVDGSNQVEVSFPSGEKRTGQVIGRDPGDDLAVVKVDLPEGVQPLTLGDSAALEVGDPVSAIGNPFGLEGTLTAGVVSGLNRTIDTIGGRSIHDAIQTDAAINHGNSGGPLFNAAGEVVGVNAQLENPTGDGNIGVGFAIPIDTAKRFLPRLVGGGSVKHAYLGISGSVVDPQVVQQFSLAVDHGVLVGEVVPNGPAGAAGIEPVRGNSAGDVILAIDGKDIHTFADLTGAIDAKQPGDAVSLTLQRGDQQRVVTVTLGEWPGA